MNFKIKSIPRFEKELKKLAKKYPSLKIEYSNLIQSLKNEPEQGTSIINNCFKIRLAIKSKGKGKSGGARVIIHMQIVHEVVYLISIFDKSDQSTISNKELRELLKPL